LARGNRMVGNKLRRLGKLSCNFGTISRLAVSHVEEVMNLN